MYEFYYEFIVHISHISCSFKTLGAAFYQLSSPALAF